LALRSLVTGMVYKFITDSKSIVLARVDKLLEKYSRVVINKVEDGYEVRAWNPAKRPKPSFAE